MMSARRPERRARTYQIPAVPSFEPYAHIDCKPYHLVVGSYLSAIGLMTSAVLYRLSQPVVT